MRTGLSNVTAEELAVHKTEIEKRHKDSNYQIKLPQRIKGPGDWLHIAILRWVGEGPTRKCGCKDRIAKMNKWGAQGCRERLDEIVSWLVEEANKQGWWRYTVAVPGSRFFIKRMVLSAIKKVENYKLSSSVPDQQLPISS